MIPLSESLKKYFLEGMFDVDDIADEGFEEGRIDRLREISGYADIIEIDKKTILIAEEKNYRMYKSVPLSTLLTFGEFENIYVWALNIDCDVPKHVKNICSTIIESSATKKIKISDVNFLSKPPGYNKEWECTYSLANTKGIEFNNVNFKGVRSFYFNDSIKFNNCTMASRPRYGAEIHIYKNNINDVKQILEDSCGISLLEMERYEIDNAFQKILGSFGIKVPRPKNNDYLDICVFSDKIAFAGKNDLSVYML